jgi:type VI secretion system protein ImpK
MNQDMSRLTYPVFLQALELRDRLDRGESPDIENEQGRLLSLLQNEAEARRLLDYGGDGASFLGVRYALTCWIDELFIVYSPWADQWNKRKLEVTLFGGTSERAWRFWKQADIARSRPGTDALEVFFLCVMLGFRGQLLSEPVKIQAWVDAVRAQVTRGAEWSAPPDLGLQTNVAPLHGWETLCRRVFSLGAATLALAALTFLLYRSYNA